MIQFESLVKWYLGIKEEFGRKKFPVFLEKKDGCDVSI